MFIIDITLPIHPQMITYPGNPEVLIEKIRTKSSFISKIVMGSHTGTHIDVPSHVFEDGKTLEQIDLEELIGPCRVLDFTDVEESIKISDLEKKNIQNGERILFKTQNSIRGFSQFYEDYIFLDGDAAEFLAEKAVRLVGIDYLSIKQKGSTDLRPHTSLLKKEIVILEGLDLSKTEEGEYNLICLPLRLMGLDGSPVRAILTK